MNRSLLTLALAALLVPAQAQTQALDLLEAWQRAEQRAPEAAQARAAREAGVARGEQAKALWRPQLLVEAGASKATHETAMRGAQFSAPGFGQSQGVAFDTSVTGGTGTRTALMLRQPLFSRERDAQAQALGLSQSMAEAEWTQARQALMLQVVEAYFAVGLAHERLRLVAQQQTAVDRAAAEARDRFQLGDRPITDVHEATARAAALQAERLAADSQIQVVRAALADLMGALPADAAPRLPAANPRVPAGALATWLQDADQGNPGLQRAELGVQVLQAQARAVAGAALPTVDLVAQAARERLSGSGDFGAARNSATQGAIGVQVVLPLYTGGMRPALAHEAQARVSRAQAERDRARQQVAQQTRAAWLDLAVGERQLAALSAALEASRARLDATRLGLQAGDRTLLDLLRAENDAAAAELALLEARTRLITSRLHLSALAGQLDEGALQQARALLPPVPQPQ
ncbi:TolC family protein [Inhella gelatinilytica]|uniref:TolC family protein n=1 Tax=Inhella gelatinilytica TaxID=2795030 RepID=A0A931IVQ3_9BURK|nr:TolC family protein [Inhella gelatinilytica]MBH9551865.1 TolC family protein [Inhella gelatinilytica]